MNTLSSTSLLSSLLNFLICSVSHEPKRSLIKKRRVQAKLPSDLSEPFFFHDLVNISVSPQFELSPF